jgi:hypothetical protein
MAMKIETLTKGRWARSPFGSPSGGGESSTGCGELLTGGAGGGELSTSGAGGGESSTGGAGGGKLSTGGVGGGELSTGGAGGGNTSDDPDKQPCWRCDEERSGMRHTIAAVAMGRACRERDTIDGGERWPQGGEGKRVAVGEKNALAAVTAALSLVTGCLTMRSTSI